ncbi:MAG: ABC transporter ATP-binding protein [Mycoplasmatales bacterium]
MISLKEVSKFYNEKNPVKALNKVSLKIKKGDFISIVGTSGSGKTTLLSILGLIDELTYGEFIFNGEDVSGLSEKNLAKIRGEHIGFVVQDFALIKEFTVQENILMALDFTNKKKLLYTVREVLKMVDLEGFESRKISELSGGQKQRIAIARALIKNPSILLCDEPTGNLDSVNSKNIIELLKKINDEGTTVIIITHDNSIAKKTNKIVMLEDGKIERILKKNKNSKGDWT